MLVRVDDVSPNTDLQDLNKCAEILHEQGADVWYCVNLFGKLATGSVYPDVPLRGKDLKYFLDVDQLFSAPQFPKFVNLVSHGLIHAEHANMDYQAQLMSILISCNFLKTKAFVPPFMSFNDDTKRICENNNLFLVDGKNWRSMETNPYEDPYELYYFHHWRMNSKQVKDWLSVGKVNA